MKTKILNWGILSTAKINRALIGPLASSKRNHLLAVASRSLETARTYAAEWGIKRAHGSYEALLADPDVDVIYNPLPNHLHAEWSIKALRAGKHVLCEKPFALSLQEVDAMIRAAEESGRVLAEAYMYRHHAQTLKVQEIVASGLLGRVRLIKGAFTFPLKREGDIRLDPEKGGGGLWDVGCYPVSYTRMLTGAEPVGVFGWQVTGASGVDESFAGQMRFADGTLAQFDCGIRSSFRARMEIVGSEASLEIPDPFKPGKSGKLLLWRGPDCETIRVRGGSLYQGEVEDMADAVLLGKAPRISLADSRGTVAALLALLESAKSGKEVFLK